MLFRSNLGGAKKSAYEVQALAADWVGGSAPYTNTITVTGLLATDNISVGLSANTSATQYVAFANGEILCTAQAADQITMTAYGTKPTVDINLTVFAF